MFVKERLTAYQKLREDVKSGAATITDVDEFWNTAIKYETDIRQFGLKDYWQTPLETLTSGRGDCEDFAIGKFYTLSDTQDVYLNYCSVVGTSEMHLTCTVRIQRWWGRWGAKLRRLDIQRGRVEDLVSFNEHHVFRKRTLNILGKATGLDRWSDVMFRHQQDLDSGAVQ